jgi:four helix bundle protein
MPSSKHQEPNSREAPRTKLQHATCDFESVAWWEQAETSLELKDGPVSGERHPFDLEERTALFGSAVIRFAKKIPRGVSFPENNRLVDQLVGAATSVGANYCEANEGVSKKDFCHPISRCVKESKEAKFFLRMVVASEPQLAEEARRLYREASELLLIFASIYRK